MVVSDNLILIDFSPFLYTALREMFKAKLGNYTLDLSSGELTRNIRLDQIEGDSLVEFHTPRGDGKIKENKAEEMEKTPSEHASLVSLNDVADEFFDVLEPSDYDQSENSWSPDFGPDTYSQVQPYNLFQHCSCCLCNW